MKFVSIDNLKKYYSNSKEALGNMSKITYAELKSLRDNSKLVEGKFYRITDFVTTVDQTDARSAGNVFDIIVIATSPNTLNENALAAKHEGDTYFANSNLDAWDLKYDLDNDKSKYAWADETNGKGVIYYLKDEFNNECFYDFKNVQYKRYKLKDKTGLHLADYPLTDADYDDPVKQAFINWQNNLGTSINSNNISFYYTRGVYEEGYLVSGSDMVDYDSGYNSYDNGNLAFDESSDGNYIGLVNIYGYFDVIAEVADVNGEWFYTFSKKTTATSATVDGSLNKTCYSNSIKEYIISGIKNLNNNIFIYLGTGSNNVYNNNLDVDCNSNTFGSSCNYNTFGSSCNYNTFGSNCYSNTFGSNCYSNTFGSNCYYNTFGSSCNYNTFGSNCYSNTFGSSCNSNTFGSNCYSNTFGSNCYYNTFGSSCNSNTFGSSCNYNTFGSYMFYNKVKDKTNSISFELYTTGLTMKIQLLTINYISNKTIPDGLITLNANYTQVLGLNEAGEVVCEPAMKQVATEADIDAMIDEVTT